MIAHGGAAGRRDSDAEDGREEAETGQDPVDQVLRDRVVVRHRGGEPERVCDDAEHRNEGEQVVFCRTVHCRSPFRVMLSDLALYGL